MKTTFVFEMELRPNIATFTEKQNVDVMVREVLGDLGFYNLMGPDGCFVDTPEGASAYSLIIDCMSDLYSNTMEDHDKIVRMLFGVFNENEAMTINRERFGMWIDGTHYDAYGVAPVE